MNDQNRANAPRAPRPVIVGACVFGAPALAGVFLGLLWWVVAPDRAEGTVLGDGGVFTGTSEALFAGEGTFVIITALAGLVSGYAAYMAQFPLARRRPRDLRLLCLVAGFLGSVAGTLLTWRVGVLLDAPLHAALERAQPGDRVTIGLDLAATAFLVAWPFVFVLQYALLDVISMLRRDLPGVPGARSTAARDDEPLAPAPTPTGPSPLGEGPDPLPR
ncbi:hypothetical protein PWG71_02740 [Nocardiopsis sp. N85]|uniref:hypothetical protein n=1 Tax=Nocardiopsis sp. N85 TaxID=3029400 RepID=UPI00237F1E87|nr:hypothetical protein [Nocardiopsis sp. N85]MDE3720290.1 hypothetical protein [Nocardiopsis sp. N85]